MTSPAAAAHRVPGHVAWVAGGEWRPPEGGPRDAALDEALLALVDAAAALGVSWLTVQEPSMGRALAGRSEELAARGIDVAGARPSGGEVPGRGPGGLRVVVAPPRSGRAALLEAVARLALAGVAPEDVDESAIGAALDVPDVDLLVVTGGDRRVPDLLTWQVAYSEIVVLDDPWPCAAGAAFAAAVEEYRRRDRRYGGLVASA